MKKLIVAILSFFSLINSQIFAQVNLVSNPSFEDYLYCPCCTNQFDACAQWLNFGNSPEYFNACAQAGGQNVPESQFGFQFAHTGSGMAGLATYRKPTAPSGPNAREFIGTQLTSTLQIGQKYFFSFYVNYSFCCANLTSVASNNIGLKFSTIPFDSCCLPPLNNTAQLYSNSIIVDSSLWIRLSGSFISDSAYNYVMLGNFFDDAHTDTMILSQFPDVAYYYLDDVCVTSDSTFNEIWTTVKEINRSIPNIKLFPNPVNDILYIKSNSRIKQITLINTFGQVVHKQKTNNLFNTDISLVNFPIGIYVIEIRTEESTLIAQLTIVH